ncbi:hypothetical protein BH11PLA2_BH11PLA2_48560 [soil metagenome]
MLIRSLVVFTVSMLALHAAPVPKGASTNHEKLVGKWELTKSRGAAPSAKHIATFDKDGTMTLAIGTGENITKYKGKFTITHDAIDYELEMDGVKKAEKLTIKLFEKDDLKVADPAGIEEEFKRVKE